MGQTGRRSIATHILAVKIALTVAHFHGFGVARQGPWVTSVNRVLLLSSPYLPAQPSRQGVSVGIVLVAQRPAVAKHHLHLGHLSPRLLRLLALPRSQREELPRLFRAPNQHERHSPWCFVQRPLDEGSPPLDELLLASWPNQPLARAVGVAFLLHPSRPPSRPAWAKDERIITTLSTYEDDAILRSSARTS